LTILTLVISEHAREISVLWTTRGRLVVAGQITVGDLRRLDDRVAAHIDGVTVAGEEGWLSCHAALETLSSGAFFASAVWAISQNREDKLETITPLTIAANRPAEDGLMSALGWVERDRLQGIVARLLGSAEPNRRMIGLAACAMHRVDPGLKSGPWLQDRSPIVCARALRTIGELGRHDLAPRCAAPITDEDPECQFWAAWSAVLLGNRGVALDALTRTALTPDAPHRARALRLALQAMDTPSSHAALQGFAKDPAQLRWLLQGSSIAGDPAYVPWLIGHMARPETARLAGEAFTLITGADLDKLQLYRAQPEDFESGPNDPEDPNVDMDPDEGLMWPDQQKIEKWWSVNSSRFPKGQRYFMGGPVTREQCIDVLKSGYQRQRTLAAHYLSLLNPGTPLFNTSAPAWRQQRLLAHMT
jgi:uncharacterized protein (TIGR02270 family)